MRNKAFPRKSTLKIRMIDIPENETAREGDIDSPFFIHHIKREREFDCVTKILLRPDIPLCMKIDEGCEIKSLKLPKSSILQIQMADIPENKAAFAKRLYFPSFYTRGESRRFRLQAPAEYSPSWTNRAARYRRRTKSL